jgi:hypothetical protein
MPALGVGAAAAGAAGFALLKRGAVKTAETVVVQVTTSPTFRTIVLNFFKSPLGSASLGVISGTVLWEGLRLLFKKTVLENSFFKKFFNETKDEEKQQDLAKKTEEIVEEIVKETGKIEEPKHTPVINPASEQIVQTPDASSAIIEPGVEDKGPNPGSRVSGVVVTDSADERIEHQSTKTDEALSNAPEEIDDALSNAPEEIDDARNVTVVNQDSGAQNFLNPVTNNGVVKGLDVAKVIMSLKEEIAELKNEKSQDNGPAYLTQVFVVLGVVGGVAALSLMLRKEQPATKVSSSENKGSGNFKKPSASTPPITPTTASDGSSNEGVTLTAETLLYSQGMDRSYVGSDSETESRLTKNTKNTANTLNQMHGVRVFKHNSSNVYAVNRLDPEQELDERGLCMFMYEKIEVDSDDFNCYRINIFEFSLEKTLSNIALTSYLRNFLKTSKEMQTVLSILQFYNSDKEDHCQFLNLIVEKLNVRTKVYYEADVSIENESYEWIINNDLITYCFVASKLKQDKIDLISADGFSNTVIPLVADATEFEYENFIQSSVDFAAPVTGIVGDLGVVLNNDWSLSK